MSNLNSHTRQIGIAGLLIILLMLGGFLLGCRSEPRPVEVVDVGPPVSDEDIVTPTPLAADPTIAAMLAATETARPIDQEVVTVTETAVPDCTPPENWVAHTVQPNDTLFSLATLTGVSVAEIKSENCMLDDLLDVGEIIYLPALPSPAPPAVVVDFGVPQEPPLPPIELTPNAAFAPFGGTQGDYANLVKAQPEPQPQITPPPSPCLNTDGTPQILSNTNAQEMGERKKYILCNFPENPLFATINGPAPDNFYHTQLAVVPGQYKTYQLDWAAECTLSPGIYTLTTGSDGNIKGEIIVRQPDNPRILGIPNNVELGQSLEVHYCGYMEQANQMVTVDLYRRATACAEAECLEHAASWPVQIGSNGTAVQMLSTTETDPAGWYFLLDHAELIAKFTGTESSDEIIIGRYGLDKYLSHLEEIYLKPSP